MNIKKLIIFLALILTACATTEFKIYEGRSDVIYGKGGTKVVVDSIEIWENGEPPRKFKVIGIIEDERPGGRLPMSQLQKDIVKKAHEYGGDAIVKIDSQSQISGYYSAGSYGNSNITTMAVKRNFSKFAVIKYLE